MNLSAKPVPGLRPRAGLLPCLSAAAEVSRKGPVAGKEKARRTGVPIFHFWSIEALVLRAIKASPLQLELASG